MNARRSPTTGKVSRRELDSLTIRAATARQYFARDSASTTRSHRQQRDELCPNRSARSLQLHSLPRPDRFSIKCRGLYIRPGDSASLNRFFPTSTSIGYPNQLLNPYSQQWTAGIERKLAQGWILRAHYVGARTLRINRPLDVDLPSPFVRTAPGQIRSAQAANCTRPYWIWWYAQNNLTATPPRPPIPNRPTASFKAM